MDEILSAGDKKKDNFYTILGCDPSSSVSNVVNKRDLFF